MAVNKITLKKVVVGTPIKTVTAGSFGINNLGGVTTTGQASGTILAFNLSSGNYEVAQFTGDSNTFITYDSSGSPDSFKINFTNDSISGNLVPRLDSAQDLGSATKKWKDLFLSGGTINIGSLKIKDENGNFVVRDSGGGTVLTNPKFITVNGDTDILAYDSNTSTFTFNDSDIARTDEDETFHKNVIISGNLTVEGTTTTVNTEEINLADNVIRINSNATGVPTQNGGIAIERGDSDNKVFLWDETNDRWTIVAETFYTTGLVRSGQIVSDSGTITNLATNVHTANTITANNTTSVNVTSTNLITGANANIDSATIGNLSITNMLASSGDSATFTNIANTQFAGSQATIDSATITNLNADSSDIRQLSTEFINFDSAFGDSATITNLANTQLTASQITVDSATINTLNVDSSDVRQISTEFINFDSAFGDSATITNIATTQLTVANANIDSAHVTNLSAANFSMSSGDSATITNIANTQLTGSQATLDSATITKLNVDSADIDHFSTENINFDSATGDSATITNIASTNVNVDQLFTDSATITNIANSVLTAKAITNTSQVGDSATITNIANSVLTAKAITGTSANIDSATIGNLATTQITLSQVTADSATINTINADSSDIRQFSTEFINADSAFIDSATIGGIALGNNDLVTTGKLYYANVFSSEGDLPDANSHHGMFAHVHGTGKGYFAHAGAWHQLLDKSSANDSATITNLASTQLTVDNATFDSSAHNTIHASAVTIDSATIINLANTQFTSSQITSDSATINTLNADSSDIRQFSTEFINFDSAFGDSATITNIANSVLTAKVITGDSATVTNIASSQLTIDNASFDSAAANVLHAGDLTADSATLKNVAVTTQLTGKDATFDSAATNKLHSGTITSDSATVTNIASTSINTDNLFVDSATVTNLANTQFTASQATIDSADIGNLRTTGVLQTDSVNATQLELLTGVTNVPAHKEGRLFYDDSNKTIGFYSDVSGLVHEVGIEEHQRVYNNTGSTIAKGKPVYFSGNYTGGAVDVPTVALADATDTAKYNAQGLTAVAIPNNSYGYIQTSGQLSGLDTSGLSAGQKVFVGLGSGLLSNTTPLYPNYPICLGWCVSSNASTGVILLNRQAHTIDSLRVVTSGHIGSNLQIDGNLTVLGSTTSVSSADLTAGTPMFRLNEGNAIGEAGTTFSGTGLDDAFYSGFFTGTANQNYYVRIDGVGTGAGGVDTFEVAFGADSTFSSPVLTKQPITGSAQMIHSTDNISINFASTTGHDSGARWAGTAGPINVDTGFFSNRNTGSSGVGFTYVGIYYDVSDDKWKLIDEYDSNPSGSINEADASYSLGTLKLDTLEGNVTGNVTGNVSGTAATVTGAAQSNITSLGTLTGLTIGGDLTLDSAGAVVYDKSEQALTFGDNHKAKFGTGGDLQVYHDGTHSYVANGTNTLYLRTASSLQIENADGSEDLATFAVDGAATLFHNNASKLATTATGVSVTGLMASTTATADSATIGNLASSSINTNALQVDDITIDGTEIDLSSGDLTIDVAGDITLDADGADIKLSDGGTEFGRFTKNGNDFELRSIVTNGDFKIIGERTAGTVNALTFDMSDGGAASFNSHIQTNNLKLENGFVSQTSGDLTLDVAGDIILDADGSDIIFADGGTNKGKIALASNILSIVNVTQDADIKFDGLDGSSSITALRLDMSEAGKATFNAGASFTGDISQETGDYLYNGGGNFDIKHTIDDQNIVFSTSTGGSTTEKMRIRGASNSVAISGTLTVGNLNVDSADIIKIARDNLSTGQAGLTYDSSGGQFGLNANHVMALIQTVDSNGSGLNAATLDGQEGTHYRINVYNNSGTLLN